MGPIGDSHGFVVGERFAASVKMRGISALGDALLGARKWDSCSVLMERDIVLGVVNAEAWEYIERVRARMREKWKECFKAMVDAERRRFEDDAYLNTMEGLCCVALGGT